jgi:hypothetical protein
MENAVEFFKAHGGDILTALTYIVFGASVITKLSPKLAWADNLLAKVMRVLAMIPKKTEAPKMELPK